jgi:hypothetical protein
MSEILTSSSSERIQELIATRVLALSGVEIMGDTRPIVQIAVAGVEAGFIDEVLAVNEGLLLPERD